MTSFNNIKAGHKVARKAGILTKQTRRSLILETKLQIIDLLEEGKSATKLGKIFGVAESSIRTIRKSKDKIKKCALASHNYTETSYRIKDVDLVNMESLLILWIEDQTERQVILSSLMIRKRAVKIYKYLTKNKTNERAKFVASTSWFERFRDRHNLHNKVRGHAAFDVYHQVANARLANLFIVDFKDFIESEQYLPDQIFCVKVTKLFWKKIPCTDLLEPAVDRMVVILSSNMAANIRCKPTAIFSMDQFNSRDTLHSNDCGCCDNPVNWYTKGTTWMNSELFQEWVQKLFTPEVKSHCERLNIPFRILLLLDKAPSHQDLPEMPNVNIMYLPSNTDTITNPMNHGIISEFQIGYLKTSLEALLEVVDSKFYKSRQDVWYNFTKNDAIDLIGQTWNGISKTTLKEAWAYILEKDDHQSRDLRLADGIESCLQLLEKFLDGVVNLDKNDILKFLKSHNQEVSNEELADFRNIFPTVFNGTNQNACGSKVKTREPMSIEPKESGRSHHDISKRPKAKSDNDDGDSSELMDSICAFEVEASPETIGIDVDEPQDELKEGITWRMNFECSNNLNSGSDELELIDTDYSEEESDKSVGYPIKDEICECETLSKYEHNNQIREGQSKESSGQKAKIESQPEVAAFSNEEKVSLGENSIKKEHEVDSDYEELVSIEGKTDYFADTSANTSELLTIAQLQRLVGLSHRLIAECQENDENPARRDRFIAAIETAMQPYNRLLDLKLGGDELW